MVSLAQPADVLFVVNNPVAHGAKFSSAITRHIVSQSVSLVADQRFSDSTLAVDVSFPGISASSLSTETNFRRLAFGMALRRRLPRGTRFLGSSCRLYAEYLFIAQAVRYLAAKSLISRLQPHTLLLTDFDRAIYARPFVWAANAAGLTTATLMHGSPNLANYVPVLADYALLWGDAQLEWIERHSPGTKSIVVGRPEIDLIPVARRPAKRIVVCHSRERLSRTEALMLVTQLCAFREEGMAIVLRLHPTVTKAQLDQRWASVAELADVVVVGQSSLLSSLEASDVVVCVASSSAVEAVEFGVPTVVIADSDRPLPADLEAIRANSPALLDALKADGGAEQKLVGDQLVSLSAHLVAAVGEKAGGLLDDAISIIRAE